MRRNNGNGNRRSGNLRKKNGGNGNSGITCWYCKRKIKGKVKYWGNHPVHAGSCYKNCCANLITAPNLAKKIRNAQSPQKKGFFARLFS